MTWKVEGPLDQVRRILLLASGGRRPGRRASDVHQLELPFYPRDRQETAPASDPSLHQVSERIHELAVEIILLIQMEQAGLVASPAAEGKRRARFGSVPALRLLEEWSRGPELADDPWRGGLPAPTREEAFARGLARARCLATALELGRSQVDELVSRLHPIAARAGAADDIPGLVHVHGLRHCLVRTSRGRMAFRLDRQRSRGTGVLYTPPELIQEVAGAALGDAGPDPGRGLLVCDPACGSGQFLLSAAARLLGLCGGSGAPPEDLPERIALLRSIHGVDLDARAARLAAHNLSLWTARVSRLQEPGPVLDSVLGRAFPYLLGDTIQVGDALSLESSSFSAGFKWERRFPHVFERDDPGFDVVLGNPPWLSFGLRDRESAGEEERAFYDRLFPAGAQYKLNLYPLFIELALRITRPGGRHGFLVPDSLLAGHHFSRIRARLVETCHLLELTLLESAPWPGANTGYTVFYAARRKGGSSAPPSRVRNRVLRAGRGSEGAGFEGFDFQVPAEQYHDAKGGALRVFREKDEVEFLGRMQESPLRMRDVLWSYSGLIARYGQKSVQSESIEPVLSVHDRQGREVHRDSDATPHWRRALLSGAEVLPWEVRWRGGYVYLPEERDRLQRVWKSGFSLDRYHGAKIFLRQTGDRLIGAVDLEGYFCLNNLHVLGARDSVPVDLLLAALHSSPIQRYYRICSPEVSRPLAQVDLKILEDLPYPIDAQGRAIGADPAAPRSHPVSRRLLRAIDRGRDQADLGPLREVVQAALQVGEEPIAVGSPTGGQLVTLALERLLELRAEDARGSGGGSSRYALSANDLLDQVYQLFFRLGIAEVAV